MSCTATSSSVAGVIGGAKTRPTCCLLSALLGYNTDGVHRRGASVRKRDMCTIVDHHSARALACIHT